MCDRFLVVSGAVVGQTALSAGFPSTDFTNIGPQVGERFPDIVRPDQHGNRIDLHAVRGDRPGLVILYRSARW